MDRGKIGFVVGLRAEAVLLRGTAFMVGVGGGEPAGAAVAASELIADGAMALVSFGLAGGLNPRLLPGAILIPERVVEGGETFFCEAGLVALLGGATCDAVCAGGSIAQTVEQKAELLASTASDAIDLESGSVARVAAAYNVPFAVLRAVADPALRDLPPAAMLALSTAGKIDMFAVLASIFAKPTQLPSLIGLAKDAGKARGALARAVKRISGQSELS